MGIAAPPSLVSHSLEVTPHRSLAESFFMTGLSLAKRFYMLFSQSLPMTHSQRRLAFPSFLVSHAQLTFLPSRNHIATSQLSPHATALPQHPICCNTPCHCTATAAVLLQCRRTVGDALMGDTSSSSCTFRPRGAGASLVDAAAASLTGGLSVASCLLALLLLLPLPMLLLLAAAPESARPTPGLLGAPVRLDPTDASGARSSSSNPMRTMCVM